jgi:hypothetical protein
MMNCSLGSSRLALILRGVEVQDESVDFLLHTLRKAHKLKRILSMNFCNGLTIGVIGTLLVVGVANHFFGKGSALVGRIPRWRQGVATKVEQKTLNGFGILCIVCETVLTLFFALLFSEAHTKNYDLVVVFGWLTSSLLFGILFSFLGTRTATVIFGYNGTQRTFPDR